MVCICKYDLNFVRSSRKIDEDKRLAARVSPVPRRAIDTNMDVSDTRRHIESIRAKHRHNSQILSPILDKDPSMGQRFGQRRIDDDLCRGLLLSERHNGGWPEYLSCALSYNRGCEQTDCHCDHDN